ncbi:hypothetical protein L0B52_07535 [Suttonella sp. R2A3]|uniref:hypothetical protein n=1 Tax=Suttonella sp. R2A3 TaxID=2908648 RepID=UPI001F17BCFD|nr:hypothetical protein [Suttonella sp. R2A3]UJF24182.1 hypothetical protein L0B52_07535 [Suttonella sp. R2A3]
MKRQKLVIVHGLFMRAPVMLALHKRLSQQGFDCKSINYPTRSQSLHDNAQIQIPALRAFAQGEPLGFIGHSLGGLLIRHLQAQWPEGFSDGRVVSLGTPHQGSAVAAYLYADAMRRTLIKHAWPQGLDGNAPDWPQEIPLLSIAGSKPYGVGRLFQVFDDASIHDGTVSRAETHLPSAHAELLVDHTHMSMLFASELIVPIAGWLRS